MSSYLHLRRRPAAPSCAAETAGSWDASDGSVSPLDRVATLSQTYHATLSGLLDAMLESSPPSAPRWMPG